MGEMSVKIADNFANMEEMSAKIADNFANNYKLSAKSTSTPLNESRMESPVRSTLFPTLTSYGLFDATVNISSIANICLNVSDYSSK